MTIPPEFEGVPISRLINTRLAIATGSSLLANRRFDQLDVQIRTEAGRFM
jgi:hypothetical protein